MRSRGREDISGFGNGGMSSSKASPLFPLKGIGTFWTLVLEASFLAAMAGSICAPCNLVVYVVAVIAAVPLDVDFSIELLE